MEFVPPKRVYQQVPKSPHERHEQTGYTIPGFLSPVLTKTGGMASLFEGHPFPRKGFIYSEAVMAVEKAKRVSLALFKPLTDILKGPLGFLESYLYNYNRLIDSLFADCERVPYLHYQYYREVNKSLWNFTYLFLRKLGISFDTAYKTGLIVATILENDDAYLTRVQDVLHEASRDALLANPRKEIKRLLKIYQERDLYFQTAHDEHNVGTRLIKLTTMLSYLLWLPPVKRAFRFAVENINFDWFKYDAMDYYWVLNRPDYNALGRTFEDRKEEQISMMMEFAEKMYGRKAHRVEDPDGTIKVEVYDVERTVPVA